MAIEDRKHIQMELFEIEEIRQELKKGPEFFSISEAADMLKLHYISVYRLVSIGEIAASMVGGCWRIPSIALQNYLERRHPFNRGDRD